MMQQHYFQVDCPRSTKKEDNSMNQSLIEHSRKLLIDEEECFEVSQVGSDNKQVCSSKKQVRFDDVGAQVVVVQAPSPEERSTRWYTAEDLSLVRKATRLTLKELEKHGGDPSELDSDIHCLRGLDQQILCYRDRTRHKRKRDMQRNFILSVLEQQFCHQQMGISDPRGLGMFARACSKWARDQAVAQAAEDALDAHRACMDDNEFCSSILRDALDLVEREDEDMRCSSAPIFEPTS